MPSSSLKIVRHPYKKDPKRDSNLENYEHQKIAPNPLRHRESHVKKLLARHDSQNNNVMIIYNKNTKNSSSHIMNNSNSENDKNNDNNSHDQNMNNSNIKNMNNTNIQHMNNTYNKTTK